MKLFHSRHLAQAAWLQRRTFLKAVSLGIAAPLAYKMSRLATAAPGPRPTRLFLMFLPHGAPAEHYEVGAGMDFGMSGVGILSPLEAYRNQVQVLRGVSNNISTNHAAITTVLTGGEGSNSIDFDIATKLGATAHVLGVQPYRANSSGPDADSRVAYHGGWVTPITNPADALEDLFPGLQPGSLGSTPAPDQVNDYEFRNEAINLTQSEIALMQAELSGLTTEVNKLQIHMESLEALKAAQQGGGGIGVVSCEGRPPLPTAEALAGADPFDMSKFGNILDGHLEAAANAFLCGTSRVITLQCMYANAQLQMDFPGGPGIAANHHDPLSHSSDAAGREKFAQVQQWFYSRLADKFLSVLNQPDPADPEHTVLDNMTILTTSELSDGQNHNSDHNKETWIGGKPIETYLPWVLIGGGGGYFAPGKSVTLEKEDHRNILAAVAASMGAPLLTIGGANVTPTAGVKA